MNGPDDPDGTTVSQVYNTVTITYDSSGMDTKGYVIETDGLKC